jgi:hypothetical protein
MAHFLAKKVIILAVCCSIALGDAARIVLPVLLPTQVMATIEVPMSPAESSIPEESPTESSNSGDSSKKPETDSYALPRKNQRRARFFIHLAEVERSQAQNQQALFRRNCWLHLPSEYSFRNGCGSNLRC